MRRPALGALHRATSCGRLPRGQSIRWYSARSPESTRKSARVAVAGTILVVGGYALAPYFFPAESRNNLIPQLPRVKDVLSGREDDIPVTSPVKALDLEGANKKLREKVHTFSFPSKDGGKGRIDVVRVPSNNPVEDNWSVGIGRGLGSLDADAVFAGVYDGHAGWATSSVLRESLIPYVSASLAALAPSSPPDAVDSAIKAAFRNLDDRIMRTAKEAVEAHKPGAPDALSALAPALAGSCALLTIYDPLSSTLRTAVTGDSRAVLGSWSPQSSTFSAEALSVDQNGFNQDEVARISEAHPGEKDDILDPRTGRLLGMAITRGFGDHRWKYPLDLLKHIEGNFFGSGPRPKYKTPPYMTAEPEVTTRQVATDDFAILASDGLWDHMSNEDAVACVSRWLAARRANRVEVQREQQTGELAVAREGFGSWRATPEHFSIEDLDNAAVCLVKNAFGGSRRELFRGVMTETSPRSRYVRDDVTVQVIFFKDPYTRSS